MASLSPEGEIDRFDHDDDVDDDDDDDDDDDEDDENCAMMCENLLMFIIAHSIIDIMAGVPTVNDIAFEKSCFYISTENTN